MIIFRYLTKEIASTLLASTLIFLLIFLSIQFVHFMRSAAAGNLTAHMAMLLLSLEMPALLGTLLPLALFLGILLAYGRMYADNEMTVLFACGVGWAKIMKIAMCLAVFVFIIVAVLMLWVTPHVKKYADTLLHKGALSPLKLILPGQFQEIQDGKWILYTQTISSDHKRLHDVFVANKDGDILVSESAHQETDKKTGDIFLVFNHGHYYSGQAGQKNYQIIKFDHYGNRIDQNDNIPKRKEGAMPTSTLWHYYKSDDGAAAELQWRLSMPIMALILALIAVPLSRVRTRQGRYAQLVPAMLLYIIYGNFMFLGRSWIRDGTVSHALGMWWTHGIMLAIAIILIIVRIFKR
jgi:lipopolysaccharide export system permease protein